LRIRSLPFPRKAQEQVAEITRVEAGPGWSLHAKTGWQNAPGAGVGWWVGWVRKGDQKITPFASSWGAAACRSWGACQNRQGGLSLPHERNQPRACLSESSPNTRNSPPLSR
jgi:hypothetical protein